MPAPENSAPKPGGSYLRPISPATREKLRQYEIDYRFVREVERMEWDGRCKNRSWLEKQMGITSGVIAEIRRGRRGVLPTHIALLKQIVNADHNWILFGGDRPDIEKSAPYMPGRGRLDVFEGYAHRYGTPAGWKVGPRPEQYPACYPDDPENKQWKPHALAGKHTLALVKGEEKSPAVEGGAE